MLTFRRLICLLLALGLLTISAVAEMPNPTLDPNANPYDETHPELLEADQLYCTSAILIEQSTGEVIFEKNADLTMYPASTTKIMTVLLGILNSNPDDKVTVSYNGSAAAMRAIDSEATVISLQEGEELTMQDLLFGTLIRSGNDGAVAIAEAVAGNESTFVALMNQTAHDLGMNSTHFMNPHGLHDDNHYTTGNAGALRHAERHLPHDCENDRVQDGDDEQAAFAHADNPPPHHAAAVQQDGQPLLLRANDGH